MVSVTCVVSVLFESEPLAKPSPATLVQGLGETVALKLRLLTAFVGETAPVSVPA